MKKAVIIGLVVILAALGYFAMNKPPSLGPDVNVTETAAEVASATAPVITTENEDVSETAEADVTERAVTETEVTADAAPTGKADVEFMLSERSLGSADAPVTVVEYASLTCPHCAHFATEILPELKAKLVETGKIRLIYRDFPIDGMAMKAAKMARCAPKDKYFDLIEVIFRNQARWIAAPVPETALMQFGALSGMSQDYMRDCMANQDAENALLKTMQEAQSKYMLKSTPSFVFNYGEQVLSGAQPVEKFEEVIAGIEAKAE